LKRILVDGGYIEGSTYYYYLTDHLGNNRVVANMSGTVQQTNHYYPYGMTFDDSTSPAVQPYKYGGKEFDKERSLNWSDFHARQYMNDVPRFTTIDPLAEKYPSMSPYAYVANNPIKYIDIAGDSLTLVGPNTQDLVGAIYYGLAKGTNVKMPLMRGLPYGHTQPGVNDFVYGRDNKMKRRLGYD
jgi:RHS repeat-associated protein